MRPYRCFSKENFSVGGGGTFKKRHRVGFGTNLLSIISGLIYFYNIIISHDLQRYCFSLSMTLNRWEVEMIYETSKDL